MSTEVLSKHIVSTPGIVGGKPRIVGHRITVQDIAIWHECMGKSADEIALDYGLTLAEVYAALSHYFDNRKEIDESIRRSDEFVEKMRTANPSATSKRLKELRGE